MWRTGGRATRACLAVSVLLVLLTNAARASAADPDGSSLSRAHDAYARGAAAYAQGDYSRAARELSAADALVPDAVTLRAAIEAVTLADDAVLGVELIGRAARGPQDAALAHAVSVAQERFAHRTGAIVVRCDGCLALIDNAPVPVGELHVVLPGVHLVAVQRKGPPVPRLVTVAADETREVIAHSVGAAPDAAPDPSPAPRARAHESEGVSPAWFVAAAGVLVALGAVTIGSAVDTANDHSAFENAHCDVAPGSSCQTMRSAGQSAQTRTSWFGVATGAAAAGTTALGLFGIRWHRMGGGDVAVDVRGSSAYVRLAF